jgi:pilus assembly protein CpaE
MSNALSVVLIIRNDMERSHLRMAFEALSNVQVAGERSDLRAGLALAQSVDPDILVLELSSPVDDILNAASQYRLDHPDTAIFYSADVFDADTLLRAVRSGAQEILRRPLDRSALSTAVERVAALRARKLGGAATRSVITVFSNKGGSGVSTLATNLAVSMRNGVGREVALVDFDHQSGDVAFMMGLNPARTVSDVLSAPRLDSAVIQDALVKHSSGVYVLSQAEQLDRVDGATAHQIGNALEVVSHTFEVVVVDCPHSFNEVVLEIFDRTTSILLVVEPTLPSIRAARRSLEIFHKLNYTASPDRVRLIVNRANDRGEVTTQQIADTLGLPVFASITNDYNSVIRAINAGKPVCEQSPESRVARDLVGLAKRLAPGAEVEPDAVEVEVPARPAKFRLFGKGRVS